MRIIIKTKNLELTNSLKNYIEKKLFSLKKFISILKQEDNYKTLAEINIEVEKETKRHRKGEVFLAKAKIDLPGKSLIAKSKSEDLLKAIVEIKEKLKMEIEKYKFKKIDKNRRVQRILKRNINLD